MGALKDRLHADLTTAMKAQDELTRATLRMVLSAITIEEVAGRPIAAARDLLGPRPDPKRRRPRRA